MQYQELFGGYSGQFEAKVSNTYQIKNSYLVELWSERECELANKAKRDANWMSEGRWLYKDDQMQMRADKDENGPHINTDLVNTPGKISKKLSTHRMNLDGY